jgi:D-alanyl-D-alanine dipeptidase
MKTSNIRHCKVALFGLFLLVSTTTWAQNVARNKYGLEIIDRISQYKQLIAKDSNQQLIEVTSYIPGILTDVRYATTNNFTKQQLYKHPAVFLRLPAAKALKAVQADLKKKGLGLKIFDGYRPYQATEKMWEIVPDDRYAADPKKGSGHNRGVAVDLTIVELKTGRALNMPTDFDDFTEKAHFNYTALESSVIANRNLLRTVMVKHGFKGSSTEWWHYYLLNYKLYPLMNIPFEQLGVSF